MSTDSPNNDPAENDTPAEGTPVEAVSQPEMTEPEVPSIPSAPAAAASGEASLASGLEIGGTAVVEDSGEEEITRPDPVIRGKVDRYGVAWGTGRRKTAVARVRLKEGGGTITVNGREFEQYFPILRDQKLVLGPLSATSLEGKVDIIVNVNGGGPTGQTGAVVLGIARAIQAKHPELHQTLSEGGFLTRDGRMVERKKYGFKKARRSFQFSKR
ncbi:30S ribosomal protein S9 [Thalassoglobus sp. JC818]|uniref:30S ribosomal protein S9 n=1 Tax=Thalassoglobus sp. JC818 TaxID=3232136 RepID=UPI00345899E8